MKLFKKKLKKLHWSDITINDHQRILEVYDKYRDDFDNPMMPYDLVCAAYGKPWEWMETMQMREANEYVATLEFLTKKPRPTIAKRSYDLGGRKYITTFNMQNISTAQYIDFQQMADKSGEMPAEFLSIILVPEGHKYNEGYEMEEVVNDIKFHMNVEDALGLTAFFLRLLRASMRRSLRLLRTLRKKAAKEGKMTEEQLTALKKLIDLIESESGLKEWTL